MKVNTRRKFATEISNTVVKNILNIYPEEQLEQRPIFKEALAKGEIDYSDLRDESSKILIPWQIFFLSEAALGRHISHIEEQREYKVSRRLMAKRKGSGAITSKRIIDRLIRQQNYLVKNSTLRPNLFAGSLAGQSVAESAKEMIRYFGIDRQRLWSLKRKSSALEYLIGQIETKQINVSRGVLTNGILPYLESSRDVYRNTSGFAIKDDIMPFVFLPSEINPEEVESRQIYTLLYLVVVIGMNQYQYILESNFSSKMLGISKKEQKIHAIVCEVLMPRSETEKLKALAMTLNRRDEIAQKFKVSPTALVTTLYMRRVITKAEYEVLIPEPFDKSKKKKGRSFTPKVSTSVLKFCGLHSHRAITEGIRSRELPSTQAQYLIFGTINKLKYRKYRNELGL